MRCETVRDALPALARGTTGRAESTSIRAHITGCAACAAEWRIAESLVAAREAAPAGLGPRVSAALSQSRMQAVSRRRLPRTIRWAATAGLATAATIALLLAWPDAQPDEIAERNVAAPTAASADPFLDDQLFARDVAPLDAALDDVLEGVDPRAVATPEETDAVPPLAMDLGTPLGDWPGADGTSAGAVMLDDLTYGEMQLLLSEMET